MSNKSLTDSKVRYAKLSIQTHDRVFRLVEKQEQERGISCSANSVITEAISLLEKKAGK